MAKSLVERLEHAWSAFRAPSAEVIPVLPTGGEVSYGFRPERIRYSGHSGRRIISTVITQLAVDAAGVELRHVKVGEDDEYLGDVKSYFNECMTVNPNLDQSPSQFRQDMIYTMLEEGVVAIVPVETTINPELSGGYDIKSLRAGPITSWMPKHVKVNLYNENLGIRQEVIVSKEFVAIVENPLYEVMNAPNSTLQRLLHKLSQLDVTDERIATGKLDIILKLPYTIKHEARRREADKRRSDLEAQLQGNQYGIGYIDGAEQITQLNRPSENNLLAQVEMLEKRLYAELGLTEAVFFGTADESAMINYHNRTVYPIVRAIQEEMKRKFLTKTARTQGHSVKYFRNPFALVPVSQIAEIADKFTRNEIMSPNEFRPIVGLRPVDDPKANELRNRNMPAPVEPEDQEQPMKEEPKELEAPKPLKDDNQEGTNPDEEA